MEHKDHGLGLLPPMAPLATPSVPFQLDCPPVYDAPKGLSQGTLFPGLELPFMGYINKENKPMTPLMELQALAFAIQELTLYLDTHRNDKEAFALYSSYQKIYQEGKEQYEQKYGPLTQNCLQSGSYQWLEDPWPWEYAENKEG